ncbi:hypothetical protein SK128_000476 [Halocaridina rubra]|uniref:Neurotransmitter-gated ion-channel ligand-binding domain-containing protein n=1 Tax=Halocaridina rubra TaxID=373956 RepID=A0AAN8XC78_HALRR
MEFTVDFLLKLAWHDHRLSYYNLKNETDLNSLAREERNLIWIPTLSFKTARGNRHTVFDDEARIHILKMGEPQTPSMTMLHEGIVLFCNN